MRYPLVFFWMFVVTHVAHAAYVLIFAERLERNKRRHAGNPQWGMNGLKVVVAALLFLPGFLYADLRYIWLVLFALVLLFGIFVLTLASGFAAKGASGEEMIPESEIPGRAKTRRLGIVARGGVLLVWIYAWRQYF